MKRSILLGLLLGVIPVAFSAEPKLRKDAAEFKASGWTNMIFLTNTWNPGFCFMRLTNLPCIDMTPTNSWHRLVLYKFTDEQWARLTNAYSGHVTNETLSFYGTNRWCEEHQIKEAP